VRETTLDAVTTCLKMALTLLEFICQEYLGNTCLCPGLYLVLDTSAGHHPAATLSCETIYLTNYMEKQE